MPYGQDSPDANYSEYFDDNSQTPVTQPPAPEPSPPQFVPIEKYQQLEQQFNQVLPKMDLLDKMQGVFAPQQTPNLTPEEQQAYQTIQSISQNTFDKHFAEKNQMLDALVANTIEQNIKNLGFEDTDEGELWLFSAERNLKKQNDVQAQNLLHGIQQLRQANNYLGLLNLVQNNFSYLDNFAGAVSRSKINPQQIGHSFVNSGISHNQFNPDTYNQKLSEAIEKGDRTEINKLQTQMHEYITKNR